MTTVIAELNLLAMKCIRALSPSGMKPSHNYFYTVSNGHSSPWYPGRGAGLSVSRDYNGQIKI